MEYNLIKFNPDFYAVHPYISYGRISYYDISENRDGKEYDHQGFEYEYNSLEKVCNHAAAMIDRIEKNADDESAQESLKRDYRNALKCLSLGNHGRRERIDNFTKYMLDFDWETVTESIKEMHDENGKTKQDELIDCIFIPDYGSLLVKMGDWALFEENNTDKALTEYSVAAYNWRSKFSNRDTDFSLEVGTKEKIKSYIALYSAIQEGRSIGKLDGFLSNKEKQILKTYNSIIQKYDQHESPVAELEKLVEVISQTIVDFPVIPSGYYKPNHPLFESGELNTLRTIKVIIPKLYVLGLLDEINLLAHEPRTIQNSLKELATEKIGYLENSDYEWINIAVFATSESKKWRLLASAATVDHDVKEIKHRLLIKGKIPELAYYTSWNTFSYMLPNEKADDSDVGKLSVMHLAYMNDPMEGSVIREFLFGKESQNGRKQYDQPYAFIKCFTQSVDYLPMWKMYGDDATGCCIVVDWNKTIEQNPGKHIALYRVCYLDRKKGSYVFQKTDNDGTLGDLGEALERLKKDISSLNKIDTLWGISELLLGSIAYLFKDSSYSYEKEARVLYTFNNLNNQIKKTAQSPPKLFVYTDYQVAIKELILGPKYEEISLWSPYIKSLLEKMNNTIGRANYTRLTFSDINYR